MHRTSDGDLEEDLQETTPKDNGQEKKAKWKKKSGKKQPLQTKNIDDISNFPTTNMLQINLSIPRDMKLDQSESNVVAMASCKAQSPVYANVCMVINLVPQNVVNPL